MTKRSLTDRLEDERVSSKKRLSSQTSIISRFESLRRQYSDKDYYDPYQQEQVTQQGKRKLMTLKDEQLTQEQQQQHPEEEEEEERPTKRRKSLASIMKNGIIQGVLFGSALALTAYDYLQATTPTIKKTVSLRSLDYTTKGINDTNGNWLAGLSASFSYDTKKHMRGHGVDFTYFHRSPKFGKRMQKTEQLIRTICLDQQYAFNQHFAPLKTQEDACWGVIDRDDYGVSFMTMPPPKPKRTFTYLQKQKNLAFS